MVKVFSPSTAVAQNQVFDGSSWVNQGGLTTGEVKVSLEKDNIGLSTPTGYFRNNYFSTNSRFMFANYFDTSGKGIKGLGLVSLKYGNLQLQQTVYELLFSNGGTASTEDYVIVPLGITATKYFYTKVYMRTPYVLQIGALQYNYGYGYVATVAPFFTTADFKIEKMTTLGSLTSLATEAVDLADQFYTVEFLVDFESGGLYAFRDGSLILTATDTSIPEGNYFVIRAVLDAGQSAYVRMPLIVTWE